MQQIEQHDPDPAPAAGPDRPVRTDPSPWRKAGRRFIRQPAGIIGTTVIVLYVLMSLFPSLIAPHDPLETFRGEELASPSADHWFGTDPIGRDVFSRTIHATSLAMRVGLLAVTIGVVVGSLTGFLAAFRSGRVSTSIMRFWEGVFAMPAVLLGLALGAAIGPGLMAISIAVGVAAAPALARVAYGSGLQQMEVGYIETANALGIPAHRTFFGHLLPNALGPVIVQAALFMGVAVLLEASLSFLGVGIQPPQPSWGGMLAESQRYISTAWWYGVFPGIAIAGLVLGLNMCADAARDALDPRS